MTDPIDPIKVAINSAYLYLRKTLEASGITLEKVSGFRVEEAEKNEAGNYKITLSYELIGDFPFDRRRELKDFEIGTDGEVISMKIRKI